MTEHDATQPLTQLVGRQSRQSAPGDPAGRGSYETGESSASGSLLNAYATDTTLAIPSTDESTRRSTSSPRDAEHIPGYNAREAKSQRTHKHRSGGAFLLQDALYDDGEAEVDHAHRRRQSRHFLPSHKARGSPRTSDKSGSSANREVGLGIGHDDSPRAGTSSPPSEPTQKLSVKKREPANGKPTILTTSPPRPVSQALDVDATQIVNMALNLSESRRMAARRTPSQQIPPKLAPLPDSTAGGSLRQHLQQQRKTSRNISPRPDRGLTPRLGSSQRINSPLHASFDLGHDTSFRYQFSASTIARAQKAKEHLELMAQHRRLMELVPPIRPSVHGRPTTASPPGSPSVGTNTATVGSSDASLKLGRHYNPLQYIRNRKVRARERKAIDGAAQGFGDVLKVTDWVDGVAKFAATGQSGSRSVGGNLLPNFADADHVASQASHTTAAATAKPKRPRVDWVVDPADMIADVYWLEQDNHWQLIEDRHWRRIFPQTGEAPRPFSRQTDEPLPNTIPAAAKKDPSDAEPPLDPKTDTPKLAKSETQHSHGSTRDRARQKLHELKGLHHRHNSSVHSHHDFLRLRKGSFSDLSDSDNESKTKRDRSGTITSTSKDILEKQMMEMIAREARDGDPARVRDPRRALLTTPERDRAGSSQPPGRRLSVAEISESDEKAARERTRPKSPHHRRPGRPSLDIPTPGRRGSFDMDSSLPNSPDGRPAEDSFFIPPIGGDLSLPPTRPGSPTRNPFTRVKHIFRERSADPHWEERDDVVDPAALARQSTVESSESPPDRKPSPERRGSKSPVRKIVTSGTGESHKSHRSIGGIRLRGEDHSNGVRGMFKGARIDTVIRGGVSRLGDFIWRKDAETVEAQQSEGTTTDESDAERTRGRRRDNLLPTKRGRDEQTRRYAKEYLEVMPTFRPTPHDKGLSNGSGSLGLPQLSSRPSSRQSSRFELLKPPRIEVKNPSPSTSPPSLRRPRGSDISDTDSRSGSYSDAVLEADKRLNSIISMPPSFASTGRHGSSASQRGRHWSISDRSPSPRRAQISKREVARLRALVLSSGIKAMEISRRVNEPHLIFAASTPSPRYDMTLAEASTPFWPDIAKLSPNPDTLRRRPVAQAEIYQAAANALGSSIQRSGQQWQESADRFASETTPALQRRVEDVRTRIAIDLSAMTRAAADEADETSRDLALGQRLKIKRVVDIIEKMLRHRRRRFRWVRRALWLTVEWVLVGFMWYVWFVVMILRVFWGVGQGVVTAARWLLWL